MNFTGLVIATPFYEVKAYSPYIISLVSTIRLLDKMGIRHDYYEISGDSYVDRAKNALVHQFLKSDFSHLLMIDSDMAWEPEAPIKLLRAAGIGAEIVGAAYPCKNNWEFYGCIPELDENGGYVGYERDGMRLLRMYGIPGGFILYSRAAFNRTVDKLGKYVSPETGETIIEAFRCNIEDGNRRIGEDIYFQTRYRECGGVVWLEPDITLRHYGIKAWEGNYHRHLLRQRIEAEQQAEAAKTAVAALTPIGDGAAGENKILIA